MNEYVELLMRMISIPSLSREEKAVAAMLEKWLSDKGLPVKRKMNNLWLDSADLRPGDRKKKTLLLNAHIDTVRPSSGYSRDPFSTSLEDGKIYGLGSNDDGGSVVALLYAWRELTGKPQPYRIIWSATAEEETSGPRGLETILPEFGDVAAGIFGEPTGMKMAVAERGLIVLDCTSHGVSGHAARSEGVNALYSAMDDIEWFREYSFAKESPVLGPVRMNVTMISAGTQHNVIPDRCNFVVDVRPNDMYTNEEILATVKENVSCDVVPRSMRHRSSGISSDHPLVRRGLSLGIETFGSPTTSNQTLVDFPTVKIGPGESSRSHAADEFILVDEIADGMETYVKLADNLQL